jgi:hypothetical protein
MPPFIKFAACQLCKANPSPVEGHGLTVENASYRYCPPCPYHPACRGTTVYLETLQFKLSSRALPRQRKDKKKPGFEEKTRFQRRAGLKPGFWLRNPVFL